MEEWRDVLGYEGLYQVSDLGRVKSLERMVACRNGKRTVREIILKPRLNSRYLKVNLYKDGKLKTKQVHQLVANAFLGFVSDGSNTHVHHIDHDRTNNALSNLEVIGAREHVSSHIDKSKTTSKHTGVHWSKQAGKWQAAIVFNKRQVYLGYFTDEDKAGAVHDKALAEINAGTFKPKPVHVPSGKYCCVSWYKATQKWKAQVNGKHLGYFEDEEDAHQAVLIYKKSQLLLNPQ